NAGEATWERSLRVLGRGGRLVTCGATTGPKATVDLRRLFWYQWDLMGSTMGGVAQYRAAVRALGQGHLRPTVDSVFPLAEATEAFRRLESRFHTDAVLLVKGRLRAEEAGVRLAVEDAKPLEETLAESGERDAGGATVSRVVIELDPGHITTETIDRLDALFRRKPGHSPVEFRLPPEVGAQEAGRNLRVQADEELLSELKTLCGESAVSLVQ
ncbi:MAG: zinc-binding dehydrogenase, partial [Acidobacteria bacterium]|nr:zinc-binding dehydrogenase [Acidobacteriota bacterium]